MILKKITFLSFIIGVFLLNVHFTEQKSSQNGREKPSVNVYGTLADTTHNTYNVENITIAGRVTDIKVYAKPVSIESDPADITTTLDLREISSIRTLAQRVWQFKKRDYIEIEVTSNDARKTKNRYIIEKSKKLFCDEVNDAGAIEKELSFLAVNQLTIKGFQKRDDERDQKCCPSSGICPAADEQKEIDMLYTKTQTLIKELEDATAKLPNNQESSSIKAQLTTLIEDLSNTVRNWFA